MTDLNASLGGLAAFKEDEGVASLADDGRAADALPDRRRWHPLPEDRRPTKQEVRIRDGPAVKNQRGLVGNGI